MTIKFRRRWQGDDVDPCVCLACKGEFGTSSGDTYTFCPRCGVKFKGEFTKRNKRYREPYATKHDETKTDGSGFYIYSKLPRLALEYRRSYVASSSKYFYTKEKSYKIEERWHSSSHVTIGDGSVIENGPYGTPVSHFSWMFHKYIIDSQDQNSIYDGIRLVLIKGRNRRVIKQKIRYIDEKKMIEEEKEREKLPVCSGMSLGSG